MMRLIKVQILADTDRKGRLTSTHVCVRLYCPVSKALLF